jgi:hypothetical protein
MNEKYFDKNGKQLRIGDVIKDEMGKYRIELGSFDKNDGDEVVAIGIGMSVRKLLWPERTRTSFEKIDE